MDNRIYFSLSRVVSRLEELLRPAMEKTFWLKAEISSGRQKGQNFYCDLVETEDSGRVKAQVRCTIWGSELSRIRENFRDQGLDLKLEDGTMVGILCRVQFHPVYGLALRGLDIDPALALGEMELKKREILERLKAEGLETLNSRRELCLLPQRIGLVTSDGSAAYYDFMQTLIASGYGFKVEVADSTMQGDKTEKSILKSLEVLSKLDLDLVVICRGGGSKSDLFWLDNEAIARCIAHYPHPVWTGIGHEIDVSILDVVAHQSFKTPTAIAEELAGAYDGMATRLEQARHQLHSTWKHRWKLDSEWLSKAQDGLVLGVGKLLALQRSKLDHRMEGLRGRAQSGLGRGAKELDAAAASLREKAIEKLSETKHELKDVASRMQWGWKSRVESDQSQLEHLKSRFREDKLLVVLKRFRDELKRRSQLLSGETVSRRLNEESRKLSDASRTLRALDPKRTLERGFALVENEQGETMGLKTTPSKGDRIRVKMKKGSLLARVEELDESF